MVIVPREEFETINLSDGGVIEVLPLAEWLLEIEGRLGAFSF